MCVNSGVLTHVPKIFNGELHYHVMIMRNVYSYANSMVDGRSVITHSYSILMVICDVTFYADYRVGRIINVKNQHCIITLEYKPVLFIHQ